MPRRFREHDKRIVTDLRGIWDFAFLGDIEPDAVDLGAIDYADRMAVPGCFDATPAYAGQRGLVAYRTRAWLHDDTPHRLIFDGVHHWCRVFVAGQAVRDHAGGFTRFSVDLTGHKAGEVEIVVLVDNRFNYERSPLHQEYFDWYHFGGIARGVELHRLGTLWIDDVRVVTDDYATRAVTVTIAYSSSDSATLGATTPGSTRLAITCDEQIVLDEEVDLAASSGTIVRTLHLTDAALWSPDAPHLHLLHIQLSEDDRRERIGIRQVRVEGERVLINGEPVLLRGFCRHEFHPQFGHAQPEALLIADVQQLLDMGCNFVRGSHYPQDLAFLDLCDEAGLCVWCETIGWQHTAKHLTDAHFVDAQLAHLQEMMTDAGNRPCVIMWGVLNEGHSHHAESRPAYQTLLERLRELDPTRPVTYASNQPHGDKCFDLADILSINTYPGWYHSSIAAIPGYLDDLMALLDSKVVPAKPIIISEIGAGAIPGWRDWNNERWTEQYQAQLLETVIRHLFIDRERACGLSIWLYNDFRTPQNVARPRSYNDKGVVDEYRRPKMAYDAVKRCFAQVSGLDNANKS
ncbi:MAG TPA: glycoside hydrolase family 2 TIM barrel-domain containing protein [Abditibacteriaceae bacterium]